MKWKIIKELSILINEVIGNYRLVKGKIIKNLAQGKINHVSTEIESLSLEIF